MTRKTANWLLIGGAVLGIGYVLKSFSDSIRLQIAGLKWRGFDGLRVKFSLIYAITNRNDITATVSSLKGKLYYGTYQLSDLNVSEAVTVAPGATQSLDVQFSVSPGILIGEISKYFESGQKKKDFNLKGLLSGKIGNIPFATYVNEKLGQV